MSPSGADRLDLIDANTVLCPSCHREAIHWTDGTLTGIECPHCGHTEAFRQHR